MIRSRAYALAIAAIATFAGSAVGRADQAGVAGYNTSAPATRFEAIRYRPRARDRDRDWGSGTRSRGFTQLHGGFFDPDQDPPSAVLFGLRGGTTIEDRVQLGLALDWNHRTDRTTVVVRNVPVPAGGTVERQTILARSSSNLFPVMAFIQVSPGVDLPVSPYFGVAAGYEVLFLSAEDFTTHEVFDATYGGWGWQAWGGLGFPLSGRMSLSAEVFLNGADVERDVDEAGITYRELVPQDGVGMRFGLSWGL